MSPDSYDDETSRNRAGRALSDDIDSGDVRAGTDDVECDSEDVGRDDGVGATTEDIGTDSEKGAPSEVEYGPVDGSGPRDIVVPARLFKLVTVVTTLLAVPTVVLGFMFLDAATLQTSVARQTVLFVVSLLGIPIDESFVSIPLGLVGIGLIVAGAGIYIVGSRFRAAGMGNAEEDTDEQSTNG